MKNAAFVSLGLLAISPSVQAALLSLESYNNNFEDVSLQPGAGSWTKLDADPNSIQPGLGELVTAPAFGSSVPRTGSTMLDFRTESNEYDTEGSAANYLYNMDSTDFGGIEPATVGSGVVSLNYWICPDTWSNTNAGFTPAGIYQTTAVLNSSGDIIMSVGMRSDGTSNDPFVDYSVDGVTWLTTGLKASSGTWTEVALTLDVSNMTSQFAFTDAGSSTFTSTDLAWDSGISDASVTSLNFKMDLNVNKNFYDDFSFEVTPVPEPSGILLAAISSSVLLRRRR